MEARQVQKCQRNVFKHSAPAKAVGVMDSWHAAAREQDWKVISCFIAWSE